MYVAKYAEDKPKDCRYCYWGSKKGKCQLGKENCYYLIKVIRKKQDDCDDCPYSKGGPCIGWCTKRILGKDLLSENKDGGAANADETEGI